LVRLELGGAPSGGEKEKGASEPKEPATKDQSTSSNPELSKKDESNPKEEPTPPPAQEKKPEPKKESPPPKQSEPKKTDSNPTSSAPAFGSREERRVSRMIESAYNFLTICSGQDESYAPQDCRATEAITKYCGLTYDVQ
jgi:hypothetical protein